MASGANVKNHGVIQWQGRLLVYEQSDSDYQAQLLGEETHLPIGSELRAAIDADVRHHVEKMAPRAD